MYEGQQVAKLADIQPGNNPREFFDPDELTSLSESIKAVGVIEPIVVRPLPEGRYSIIAGERRWRGSKVAFGEDGVIPIIVRDCSDQEAEDIALTENVERSDMSATEEAQAAHRILLREKGDKVEAAARLGWTVAKFERRVALMRLTPEVRKALTERKIQLGHAELLAAVPADKQNPTLEKIIQHGVPVAAVKAQLGKLTEALADAVFDKSGCTTCEYNSECQSALFSEAIGKGYCTNRSCFEEKTEGFVASIANSLKEEVPRVEIIRATGALEGIKLVVEGRLGVGEAQASACKSCANFGCTVSALPGSVGEVEKSICFDAVCNTQKVQTNMADRAATTTAATVASAKVKAGGGTDQAAKEAAQKVVKAKATEAKAKVTSIASQRVKDYRLDVWRKVAGKVLYTKPEHSASVLVALAITSKIRNVDSTKILDASKRAGTQSKTTTGVAEIAKELLQLSTNDRSGVVNALAPSAMRQMDERDVKDILAFLEVDLALHWRLNAEFLGLLTKSEIEFVATEAGVHLSMGEKEFGKALTLKRDELIKAMLGVSGFDYEGVIPACMRFTSAADSALLADSPDSAVGSDANSDDLEETEEEFS